MSKFVELTDYDASIHRDILDALVREDETVIEVCEDRAIAEMRCYLGKRYDCNKIFAATGENRNQLVLMMVIDMAVYHIFCIHNPQKLSQVRKDRYERAVEWMKAVADEDMERSDAEKTSSVHFLRFPLPPEAIARLRAGAPLAFGVDHPRYRFVHEVNDPAVVASLLGDRKPPLDFRK